MSEARYAVYFVPAAETELYQFGSSVIGYDCYRAVNVPYLSELGSGIPAWDELTREPRTYGFHATLKAPFRLMPDACERDLCATLDRLAAGFDGAPIFQPRVDLIDRFVAIVPDHMPLALSDLADACVRTFEPFRASLSERGARAPPVRRARSCPDRQSGPVGIPVCLQRLPLPYDADRPSAAGTS